MPTEENIDQLFRSALENAKELPPPNSWLGISNQLGHVSIASHPVAPKNWFAKLGLVSKVAIIATVFVGGAVAVELLKDDDLKLNPNIVLSINNETSKNDILPEVKLNNAVESNGNITPSSTHVNKTQFQSQNVEEKGFMVYPPLSALDKVFLHVNSKSNGDNLLSTIQSVIADKSEIEKSKNETSTVLGNIIENSCKNNLTLSVVESDSTGNIINVNCNGNVKKSYLNFGDGQVVFFEGNTAAINHLYKVNCRKDFYIKLVTEFSNGCKDSAMTKVEVSPSIPMNEIMIPTVFTPNGDGKNDAYYIKIPEPENFEMMVFDKGKKMIFSTTKFRDSWNGNCFGKPCLEGNYEVVIKTQYSGEKLSVTTRWVNLNRNSNEN